MKLIFRTLQVPDYKYVKNFPQWPHRVIGYLWIYRLGIGFSYEKHLNEILYMIESGEEVLRAFLKANLM